MPNEILEELKSKLEHVKLASYVVYPIDQDLSDVECGTDCYDDIDPDENWIEYGDASWLDLIIIANDCANYTDPCELAVTGRGCTSYGHLVLIKQIDCIGKDFDIRELIKATLIQQPLVVDSGNSYHIYDLSPVIVHNEDAYAAALRTHIDLCRKHCNVDHGWLNACLDNGMTTLRVTRNNPDKGPLKIVRL